MNFVTVIASTLLFVLISQQFTSALPIESDVTEFTTVVPHVEREEKSFVEMSTEKPLSEVKREFNELFDETTSKNVEEHQPSEHSTEEHKREVPTQKEQQHTEQTEETEEEPETEETGDQKKREETTEEHVEEKPKKIDEPKVEEKKTGESSFCPEGFAKFEESCLFVGTKGKITGRSGKVSSNVTDSTIVENIPMNADNSCPPGTEHTERGVCQKILTEVEIKAKKNPCPSNGQCVFHSFDMSSTVEMPLETSERPVVESHEEENKSATETISKVESQFETTVESVLKS